MSGVDWIGVFPVLAALLAIYAQQRLTARQLKVQTLMAYSERYQEILTNLPSSIESETFEQTDDAERLEEQLRWFRAYFDLCFEEYYLYRKGLVDRTFWDLWQQGMSDSFRKPAFKWAWAELQRDNYFRGDFVAYAKKLGLESD